MRIRDESAVLAAGVCEYRGGNGHGNPMCLATGLLIDDMACEKGADCVCGGDTAEVRAGLLPERAANTQEPTQKEEKIG